MLCVWILSHASAKKKKKKKKKKGVQISHFYWLFLSDIVAVEGLMCFVADVHRITERKDVQE